MVDGGGGGAGAGCIYIRQDTWPSGRASAKEMYIYIYRQTVKEERRKEEEEEMVDNGQTLCLSAASSCIVESEREPLLTTRANLRDPSAVVYSTLSVSFPPPMESCFLPGTREGGQKKKKKKKKCICT